jgi:hypothetical protein
MADPSKQDRITVRIVHDIWLIESDPPQSGINISGYVGNRLEAQIAIWLPITVPDAKEVFRVAGRNLVYARLQEIARAVAEERKNNLTTLDRSKPVR